MSSHGLTGINRERPGLREAFAACRAGDILVVTKFGRLARSLPDARAIADELTARQINLSLGGSVSDLNDAVDRLLFNVLGMVAEFESDLIRLRTREGMKVAKAKGRLRGKQPKLTRKQEAHLVSLVHSGDYSTREVAELSESAAPRSTAPSSVNASKREPDSRRRRSAEINSRHRPSRPGHPGGTPALHPARMPWCPMGFPLRDVCAGSHQRQRGCAPRTGSRTPGRRQSSPQTGIGWLTLSTSAPPTPQTRRRRSASPPRRT